MRGIKLAAWALGILVVLGGGGYAAQHTIWGRHAYDAARYVLTGVKNPKYPAYNQPGTSCFPNCQNPNARETAQEAATGGPPFVTPAANAMLRSLKIQVVQARWLPKAWADLGPSGVDQYIAEVVDVELRVTNTSDRAIHMSNAAYTEDSCMPTMQSTNSWTEPAVLEPISANLYTITPKVLQAADTPGGAVQNSPIVYLNLKPHQTKTGWVSMTYVTNCGSSPNVVLFTDSWPSEPNGGAVTITLPIKPVGPPLPVPASLP